MQVIIFQPFWKISSFQILKSTISKTPENYLQPVYTLTMLFTNILYPPSCGEMCYVLFSDMLVWYKASFTSYEKAPPKRILYCNNSFSICKNN